MRYLVALMSTVVLCTSSYAAADAPWMRQPWEWVSSMESQAGTESYFVQHLNLKAFDKVEFFVLTVKWNGNQSSVVSGDLAGCDSGGGRYTLHGSGGRTGGDWRRGGSKLIDLIADKVCAARR